MLLKKQHLAFLCFLSLFVTSIIIFRPNNEIKVAKAENEIINVSHTVNTNDNFGSALENINDNYVGSFYLEDELSNKSLECLFSRTLLNKSYGKSDFVILNDNKVELGGKNQSNERLELRFSNVGVISSIYLKAYGGQHQVNIYINDELLLNKALGSISSQSNNTLNNIDKSGDVLIVIEPTNVTIQGVITFYQLDISYTPKEALFNPIYVDDVDITTMNSKVNNLLYNYARYMNMRLNLINTCNGDYSLLSDAFIDTYIRYTSLTNDLNDNELEIFNNMISYVDISSGWNNDINDDLSRAMKTYDSIIKSHTSFNHYLNGLRSINNLINYQLINNKDNNIITIVVVLIGLFIVGICYLLIKRRSY